jgi:hypothetical protein
MVARAPIKERFMRHVDTSGDCWLWTGSLDRAGYGRFTVSADRRAQSAARVSYELFVGPIPEGMTIDHVAARGCTSTACVNPAHLEAVTQGENVMRSPTSVSGRNIRKTHCPRGHAYDTIRNGARRCSVCDAETERRRIRDRTRKVA